MSDQTTWKLSGNCKKILRWIAEKQIGDQFTALDIANDCNLTAGEVGCNLRYLVECIRNTGRVTAITQSIIWEKIADVPITAKLGKHAARSQRRRESIIKHLKMVKMKGDLGFLTRDIATIVDINPRCASNFLKGIRGFRYIGKDKGLWEFDGEDIR